MRSVTTMKKLSKEVRAMFGGAGISSLRGLMMDVKRGIEKGGDL